jgi:hypothetical protein
MWSAISSVFGQQQSSSMNAYGDAGGSSSGFAGADGIQK